MKFQKKIEISNFDTFSEFLWYAHSARKTKKKKPKEKIKNQMPRKNQKEKEKIKNQMQRKNQKEKYNNTP